LQASQAQICAPHPFRDLYAKTAKIGLEGQIVTSPESTIGVYIHMSTCFVPLAILHKL